MIILGSGLAGMLAAALIPESIIWEPKASTSLHKAVLRFRSPDIGEALGIPFKKVRVYKGIWHNRKPVELAPKYIVRYSRKITDQINARSIVDIETADRWIAPVDFQEQLKEKLADRIHYNKMKLLPAAIRAAPTISTLPLPVLADLLQINISMPPQGAHPIYVSRFEIPDCNVYMTNYYTDNRINSYRATIEKNILIIESVWPIVKPDIEGVVESFGLDALALTPIIENYQQPRGKIIPMDDLERRAFILSTTLKYNVFSLGRFATWRNLVLDDVYKDILKIKSMIGKDQYEQFRRLHSAN